MYQIKKHKPYIIKGQKGTYEIPPMVGLDFEDAAAFVDFNSDPSDAAKRIKIAKDFLLKYAPGLADEGIGDFEYFLIFNDYNSSPEGSNQQGE